MGKYGISSKSKSLPRGRKRGGKGVSCDESDRRLLGFPFEWERASEGVNI